MILDPQGYSFCFPLLLEELQLRGKDLSSSDVGGGVLLLRIGKAASHILKLSPCTNDIPLRLFYCNQLKNTLMSQY